MYKELEKRTGEEWSVHISYMEIYQDVGFDLLNPGSRPGSLMVTLPKVRSMEGIMYLCTLLSSSFVIIILIISMQL